jgi:hypothetical protein
MANLHVMYVCVRSRLMAGVLVTCCQPTQLCMHTLPQGHQVTTTCL